MDIDQLKTLIHVAELGSVSKASERLHIAQPALSRKIRLLEEELGTRIFDRHGRGMVLTSTGVEVLEHATHVISEIEAIKNTVLDGKASFRGLIRIGMPPTVSRMISVPLIQSLRKNHPKLDMRLASAFSGYLLDWLQKGDLDVVVSYNPPSQNSLRILPVMIEQLFYICNSTSQINPNNAMPFSRLAEEELIIPSPSHGLRILIENYASRANVVLNTSIEVDAYETIIDLVRSGFGSTILPYAPIRGLVESGEFYSTPIVDPTPERRLVLAYSADRTVNPAAKFVGDVIRSIAADLVNQKLCLGHMIDV